LPTKQTKGTKRISSYFVPLVCLVGRILDRCGDRCFEDLDGDIDVFLGEDQRR